jgi:ABC-type polar amino acid transport system ATPase subunit
MSSPSLEVFEIRKTIGRNEILRGVSLSVPKGSAVAIIGPSGGGKTTLLRCINLLLPIDGGSITLNGQKVIEASEKTGELLVYMEPNVLRRRVGLVFQEWNLWPNKTVRENIAEGLRFALRKSKAEAFIEAERLCAKVGLSDKLLAYPGALSGGQKQRAAIARALAMNPEVLMLDEVTSALDPSLVWEVLEVIAELKKEGRTLLIVTHHVEFAKAVADNVAFLWGGRIHEHGPARDILSSPKTAELQSFLRLVERAH